MHITEQLGGGGPVRADDRNWCIVNRGAACADTTVVLGISGKPASSRTWRVRRDDVPLYRRFTGVTSSLTAGRPSSP